MSGIFMLFTTSLFQHMHNGKLSTTIDKLLKLQFLKSQTQQRCVVFQMEDEVLLFNRKHGTDDEVFVVACIRRAVKRAIRQEALHGYGLQQRLVGH